MRPCGSRRVTLAGALLVTLLCCTPLRAAGPPAEGSDSRRTWVGPSSNFRLIAPGRWVENSAHGRVVYRENDRHRDYIELYHPGQKRYVRLYAAGVYVYVPKKEHFELTGEGGWDAHARKPIDRTRNAHDRTHMESDDQRRSFPRLNGNYEVMAPATAGYNCICWSLGSNDSWVWPRGPGQRVSLNDFDALYAYNGFRRIAGLDVSRQEGVEKVVLFAVRRENGNIDLTHASKQLPDGSWSSKLGSLPLIRHLKVDDISGPTYGQPYVLYVRKKTR